MDGSLGAQINDEILKMKQPVSASSSRAPFENVATYLCAGALPKAASSPSHHDKDTIKEAALS